MNSQIKFRSRLLLILFPILLATGNLLTDVITKSAPIQAADGVWLGDGTVDRPYLITSIGDLTKLAADVNSGKSYANTYFMLMADITVIFSGNSPAPLNPTLPNSTLSINTVWTPIGNINNPFKGNFNGNDHRIVGLHTITFSRPSIDYVGLFGYLDGGTVKNLYTNNFLVGITNVGSIVGYNKNGIIENCNSDSVINGTTNVGSIVGYNDGGTIRNCNNSGGNIKGSANGTTSGTDYVGGVVGYNKGGIVENCFNTGTTSGSSYVGGVVGYNDSGTVKNCYNTGAVSGTSNSGGIVGVNTNNSSIENCYSTSTMIRFNGIGGVVGNNNNNSAITNCYYNTENFAGAGIGTGAAGTATGKTTAEMTTSAFAAVLGTAFGKRATISDYCYYPELTVFTPPSFSIPLNSMQTCNAPYLSRAI